MIVEVPIFIKAKYHNYFEQIPAGNPDILDIQYDTQYHLSEIYVMMFEDNIKRNGMVLITPPNGVHIWHILIYDTQRVEDMVDNLVLNQDFLNKVKQSNRNKKIYHILH